MKFKDNLNLLKIINVSKGYNLVTLIGERIKHMLFEKFNLKSIIVVTYVVKLSYFDLLGNCRQTNICALRKKHS